MKKHFICQIGAFVMTTVLTVTSVNVPALSGNSKTAKAATTQTILQSWDFSDGIGNWYYGGTDWEYQYNGGSETSISVEEEMLKVSVDYSANSASSWSQLAVCNWDSDGMNLSGANQITLDFIYDSSKLTTGSFYVKAYSNGGINSYVPVASQSAITLSGSLKEVAVTLDFDTISATSVNDFSLCIVGNQTDYKGDIYLDNINIISDSESTVTETELESWTFDSDTEGWYYGSGWEYQYDGAASSGVSYEDGKLKVDVDYSGNSGESWSQMAVCYYNSDGMNLSGANKAAFDFYYDSSNMSSGSFVIKAYSNGGIDSTASVDMDNAETVEGTIKKVPAEITFDAITNTSVNDFALCIVGNQTNYKGSLWLDNIKIVSVSDTTDDIYVNSTVATAPAIEVSIHNGNLVTDGEETALSSDVTLVDKDATDSVKQTYAYLEAMGKSSSAIFGQQNNSHHKAGSANLSYSDTYDITGSYTGIIGIDALSLVGNEYSASRYNSELGADLGATSLPETAAGNVMAAAALTNYNIENGAIITLSAHMPNFSLVEESGDYDGIHTYSKYDFSGYSPNTLTGEVMNQILPGGQYNTVYTAYLDMIADYASQVDGAILFRPFHENTGSWFWWGAAFCDAQTYQNVYRYTVEYLRDIKDIHNIIYVYGPSSEAANITEYGERYPGDNYVDMVGFDMYNSDPTGDDTWFTSFKNELNVVQTFAEEHNKLLAVTETGVATSTPDTGDNQTALHKSGNKDLEWYQKMLAAVTASNASYFLVWANFGEKDGFYTPYVKSVNADGTLYGHEMLDNFIEFYNDSSSIFAADQISALEELKSLSITASPTTTDPTGYITSPVSGSRVLSASTLTARVTGADSEDVVKFVLHGNVDKEITATVLEDGVTYSAELTSDILASLGEYVGTIELFVNDVSLNTINATFNILEPEEDPYLIDDFENYYGVDSLLTKKWSTNKASGNTISISLTDDTDKVYSGDYALKFTYNETSDGWAGATISKDVDWSDCNALSFYTIPDGNNQKVVIQITANATVYEVYLNLYDGYKDTTSPMLVTIPFSEFCQRDTSGNPKGGLVNDSALVTSFGLWVNAIAGTSAVVDGKVTGTIYYDDITAISTENTDISFDTDLSDNTGDEDSDGDSDSSSDGSSNKKHSSSSSSSSSDNTDTVTTKAPANIVTSNLKTFVTTNKSRSNQKLNKILASMITDSSKLQYLMLNVTDEVKTDNNTLKVYAAAIDGVTPGSVVYLYGYDKDTNKLESLNQRNYTVDEEGYITIQIPDARRYVILEQIVSGENLITRAGQTVVKNALAVENGQKVNLDIKIRNEFADRAKVTYKSSDKSVATIDKNGLITGKKKGTTTITTIVTIGKVTKKFKTKVTIK